MIINKAILNRFTKSGVALLDSDKNFLFVLRTFMETSNVNKNSVEYKILKENDFINVLKPTQVIITDRIKENDLDLDDLKSSMYNLNSIDGFGSREDFDNMAIDQLVTYLGEDYLYVVDIQNVN